MQKTYEFGATLQFGIVVAVDGAKHNVKVNIPALEDMETDWLHMMTAAAGGNQFYSLPDAGELVACILDARGESGVVLGAIYNEADTTPTDSTDIWMKRFSNGTVISHDRISGKVTVDTPGDVLVKAGGKVTVDAPDTIVTGNLLVKGLLTYQGGMAGSGGSGTAAAIQGTVRVTQGDVVADGKSLKTHTHADLTSGGHTGTPD